MEGSELLKSKERTKHPQDLSNFLSNLFFCWTLPVFLKGVNRDIEESDLYPPVKSHRSKPLGEKLERAWINQIKTDKDPSLIKAILSVFGKELLITGVVLFCLEFILKLSLPLLISKFLAYYQPNQTRISKKHLFVYAFLIVLVRLMILLTAHNYMKAVETIGMKIRIATSSLIYRKTLKLSSMSLEETTNGRIVNFLANDVRRFDYAMSHIHNIWSAPLETLVFLCVLYMQTGITSIVGIVLLLFLIPFQAFIGKKSSTFTKQISRSTDERITITDEILSGIQVIKMFAWEKLFSKLVEVARKNEIRHIRSMTYIKSINASLKLFIDRTAVYLCIVAYTLSGHNLDAQYVYFIVSFYEILRKPMTFSFPTGMSSMGELKVTCKRLNEYLLLDERKQKTTPGCCAIAMDENSKNKLPGKSELIKMKRVSTKWVKSSVEFLSDVSLTFEAGNLYAIIGPVGCGKTTLLNVILEELPLNGGTLEIFGKISYAPQEPWLFSGTIKQNIIFGIAYNEEKYNEVIKVCSLEEDLKDFPYSDETHIGEKGATLSGGQKTRVSLARAIYRDADVYLLDDVLSAVDSKVGNQIFNDCIATYLKNKCVVLVTHQLQFLTSVNKIFLMENGRIKMEGKYESLKSSGVDYFELLQPKESIEVFEYEAEPMKKNEATSKSHASKEHKPLGSVSLEVYKRYLKAGGAFSSTFGVCFLFVITQSLASGSDYFLSHWVNTEQYNLNSCNTIGNSSLLPNTTSTNVFSEKSDCLAVTNYNFLWIQASLLVATAIVALTRAVLFYKCSMNASKQLHKEMFDKILFATMKFIYSNPSGRILNRFSKDMGTIDDALPWSLLDTLQVLMSVLSAVTLVALVNPWALIPTLFMVLIFYFCKRYYLTTSRSVKRLEGITKSPVFCHVKASLQGLTTIRAYGAQAAFINEFENHQDLNTSAFYLLLASKRTFGMWLDLICVTYFTLVIFGLLALNRENIKAGNVGLSLTQALSLVAVFQWGMKQLCEVENNMTSVERVLEYTEVESEKTFSTISIPKTWPDEGKLDFKLVNLRYAPLGPYILKNINFSVQSREKIGIVGRTGAGKTSLISALLRFAEIEGDILIDNISIKKVNLQKLRSKISVIPQEPILFSGTLRKNLDPFDEFDDDTLWNSLEKVKLKDALAEYGGGLNRVVANGGKNFSVGERQLVCLARAILRNNKILILDEATANVDPETDKLIHETIRQQFVNCTVLTIAHRLQSVMSSDRALVMDCGSVIEFDHPHLLLSEDGGFLSNFVENTGKSMAATLKEIAEESYKKMSQDK